MSGRKQLAGALGLALLSAPTLAAASTPSELYYERTVMLAADARCRLFVPTLTAALAASQAQARGAALRAGQAPADLEATSARAWARANAADCRSTDVTTAAGRVRQAFEAYAHLQTMAYPGDLASWRADRTPGPGGPAAVWRLSQESRFTGGRMVFGLAGLGSARPLVAIAAFPDGQTPYAARLVIRDVGRTTGPYLDARSGTKAALSARVPPATATISFSAEARSLAGKDLRPADMAGGWAFRFPASAVDALGKLDPREAVAVEFLFTGREADVTRTAYVEVGDFAAGRAFLNVVQR